MYYCSKYADHVNEINILLLLWLYLFLPFNLTFSQVDA